MAADASHKYDSGESEKKGTTSFKRQRDKELKAREAGTNSLYVRTDTAAALAASRLGLEKADLLSVQAGGSVGVRAALAEAEVLVDVRAFLSENGIVADVLSNADNASTRSDTVFLVKNLPPNTSASQLKLLYAPFGDLGRVLVVPGGSVALVEFLRASEARKAFQRTVFSNFQGTPLYLQWAPVAVFSKPFEPPADNQASRKELMADLVDEDMAEEGVVSVFVKNLNFSTTEDELRTHIGIDGIRSVTIVSKNGQSLGYGFIEFRSKELAVKAIKMVQGTKLDGHALELSFAKAKEVGADRKKKKQRKKQKKNAKESSKLVVRNVPFEASKKEMQDLMGAYGSLKALRLPLKFDRSHRGYAFAEYHSKSEARKALEALENTHLYGRHLVIEYAEEEEGKKEEEEEAAE